MGRSPLYPVNARAVALRLIRAGALVVKALGRFDLIYFESRRQRVTMAAIVRGDLREAIDDVHDEGT